MSPIPSILKTFLPFFSLLLHSTSPSSTLHTNFSESTFNALYKSEQICPYRFKEVFQSNISVRKSLERGWWFQNNLKGELDPEDSPEMKKICKNWGKKYVCADRSLCWSQAWWRLDLMYLNSFLGLFLTNSTNLCLFFLIIDSAKQKLWGKANIHYYYNQTSMLTEKMTGDSLLSLSDLKPLYLAWQDDQGILNDVSLHHRYNLTNIMTYK